MLLAYNIYRHTKYANCRVERHDRKPRLSHELNTNKFLHVNSDAVNCDGFLWVYFLSYIGCYCLWFDELEYVNYTIVYLSCNIGVVCSKSTHTDISYIFLFSFVYLIYSFFSSLIQLVQSLKLSVLIHLHSICGIGYWR